MTCEFGANDCSHNCPKFSICMYKSVQTQLSEINNQLNFILTTLTALTCKEGINEKRLSTVEANLSDIVSTLIALTNDSDSKHNN
jgi:hypothetical protein